MSGEVKALWGEGIPARAEPVRADPLRPAMKGEESTALKETVGKYFSIMVLSDSLTTTCPIFLAMVEAMLRNKGLGDTYKKDLEGWQGRVARAIRMWNVNNGQWKEANLLLHRLIADVLVVALKENIITLAPAMIPDIGEMSRSMNQGGGP